MSTEIEPGAALDAMLAAAGLAPPPEDREAIGGIVAELRSGVASLYALEETRYEVPALVFRAAPELDAWRP